MLLYVDKVSREINGETKELNALRRKNDSYYDEKYFNGVYYVVSPKVELIGMGCFKNSKIRRIVLSPNLLIIDSDAFLDSDLEEIAIPKNTLIIGSSAFYICEELKNVYIPDSVISIGPFCFAQCSSLETIKLPKNLKKIESYTFATCSNLKEVILPENLETISEHAFENCVSLERLTVTTKVEIEYAAYRSLKELTVEFKELKDIIQFIKKNRVNLIPKTYKGKKQNIKIIFKGKHLTKEDKEKIEELFKYNLYDYGYIEIDYEEETKEEQITNDEDKDLQKILDEINTLCSKINEESRNIIIAKVNSLIEGYKNDLTILKPKYGEELKFGEKKKDIKQLKPELISKLTSIIENLTREKDLIKVLEDLARYKEYLKTNVTELTKEDNTIDTMIKNIIYYSNFLPEDKKTTYIERLNDIIEDALIKATKEFSGLNNENIELKMNSKASDEMELRMKLDSLYSEIANYSDKIKPFKLLYDKLINNTQKEAKEFKESDDLPSLIENIEYVINRLANGKYKEELNNLFNKTKEKYLKLLDKIIKDKQQLNSVTYEDIETEIRKDIHPILEIINKYSLLDKYEEDLFKSSNIMVQLRTGIKIINEEELTNPEQYNDQIITSEIIDIINIANKEGLLDQEAKKAIKQELLKIIENNLDKISYSKITNLKEYNKITLEILKELAGVKIKVNTYIKELEEYNSYRKEHN